MGGAQVHKWLLSYPSTELYLFKFIFNYNSVITFLWTLNCRPFSTLTITQRRVQGSASTSPDRNRLAKAGRGLCRGEGKQSSLGTEMVGPGIAGLGETEELPCC